jgi:hypothetical protein
MMMVVSEHDLAKLKAAVTSLSRVRAAESAPKQDGSKSVWHQGAKGADLLSRVDSNGRVQAWELTLLTDHVRWKTGEGLTTGLVMDERGAGGTPASNAVVLDRDLLPERLVRAHECLLMYHGEDRYLLNVKRVIALAVGGMHERLEVTVTKSFTNLVRPMLADLEPTEVHGRKKTWTPFLLLGALALAVLVGVVAGYLLR